MAHGTRFSEAELEHLANEHETIGTDVHDDWELDDDQASGTATITLRLPRQTIAALKRAAEAQGIGATVLARQWITERLAGDLVEGTVVSAPALMEWLVARARNE